MINVILLTTALIQAGYTESPQVQPQIINKAQLIAELEKELSNTIANMSKELTLNIIETDQGHSLQIADTTSFSTMRVETLNVSE
ncbi:MAG: hypothetical protein ACI8SJ_002164 [Shewanella sp.]|jgi:hypothetical protein